MAAPLTVGTFGCPAFDRYHCSDAGDCRRDGGSGSCLDLGCAYPDDDCASGLRYSVTADAAVAGACAPDAAASGTGESGEGSSGEGSSGTPPAPQPIARWPLDEVEASSALDLVGDNDGTYFDVILGVPSLIAGDSGTAASFDGSASYLTIPDVPGLHVASYSIVFYVRPRSFPETDANSVLLEKDISGGVPGGVSIELRREGDLAYLAAYTRATQEPIWVEGSVSDRALVADRAYRVVLTVDAAGARLYLDSQVVATSTNSTGWQNNDEPIALGAYTHSGVVGHADVVIDDLAVYDRALTETEIASLPEPTSS